MALRLARRYSLRRYGQVLDPGLAMFHHRGVLATFLLTETAAGWWRRLDPTLGALAVLAAASRIGCSWCMDFGYWESRHRGVDPAKLRAVPGWRESDLFTDLERQVLTYAEAMTETEPAVTDAMVEGLRRSLSDRELVELTALAALENQRSRINAAFGLTSQGFRETCDLASA